MQTRQFAPVLLFLFLCPLLALAQTDTTSAKKPMRKNGPNTTRLDLSYSNSHTKGSWLVPARPYISINGSRPVRIDKNGDILRRYYTRCAISLKYLEKMDKTRRMGKVAGISLSVIGGLVMFSSPYIHSNNNKKIAVQIACGTIPLGSGILLHSLSKRKATNQMITSVDYYNATCYKPLPGAEVPPAKAKADSTAAVQPGRNSPQ
jgi:hypothetical protein